MRINRGNHSIEFCELEKGLHELHSGVYAWSPPQRMDGINSAYYEPMAGITRGLKINGEFLVGALRGFMPRWNMPVLGEKENDTILMQIPRWGWQGILDRCVAKGVASEDKINKKFGITLATDTSPYLVVERSEDRHGNV